MSTSQFAWALGGKPIVLDQLDEELRVACALAVRPGLQVNDVAIRTVALIDDALRPAADAAFAAHIPDPGFIQGADITICRLYLGAATPTNAQTVAALKALIRIVRGIAT
jgi:hypothetical protein